MIRNFTSTLLPNCLSVGAGRSTSERYLLLVDTTVLAAVERCAHVSHFLVEHAFGSLTQDQLFVCFAALLGIWWPFICLKVCCRHQRVETDQMQITIAHGLWLVFALLMIWLLRVNKFLELRNFRTAGTRLSYALLTAVVIDLAVLMIVKTELTLFEFNAVLGLSCVYYV